MKKRIFTILLALCMVLTMMPTAAFADGGGGIAASEEIKDITLHTSSIKDPTEVVDVEDSSKKHYTPQSYIYFGMNGTTPIKWRVLDADKANDGTTDGMFLLSEYVLAKGIQFNADQNKANASQYQGSDAQAWCSNFATNSANFSSAEQKAMLGVAKTDSGENLYGIPWGASSLATADKLFLLSARELADYVGNYRYASGLAATDAAQAYASWWLRSLDTRGVNLIGAVNTTGAVGRDGVHEYTYGVRPALNLNPASVLFTSAAVGGKTSGSDKADGTTEIFANKNFADITDNDGYKLTLLDENRSNFTARLESLSNGTARVAYSGASTGTNEYISLIIKNGDIVKYYGRVAAVSNEALASGKVEFTLPSDFSTANGDVLCVFNEQYNGDKKTDYASNLIAVDAQEQKSSGSHKSYRQKPTIVLGSGSSDVKTETAADGSTVYTTAEGKLVLSRDGRTASVTPAEDYEVENINISGTDKGAVTTLTGLRTGDKLVVSFKLTVEAQTKAEIAQIKALAEKMSLTARSTKTAKKNIKVTLKADDESTVAIKEIKSLGYTVKYKYYRSTKKTSKYAAKVSKTGKTYTNTKGKNGTKYYYKARVQIFDANGKLVTQTALKQCKYASRTWTK